MAGGASSGDVDELELRLPSDPRYVAVARSFVEQAALAAGLGERQTARVVLAVGEAVSNVIRHCYGGRDDWDMLLGVGIHSDRIEICLQDYGRRVSPEELRARPNGGGELKPGGLGLHIIREVMDQVDLSFVSGAGNRLTMVKFLDGAAGEGTPESGSGKEPSE